MFQCSQFFITSSLLNTSAYHLPPPSTSPPQKNCHRNLVVLPFPKTGSCSFVPYDESFLRPFAPQNPWKIFVGLDGIWGCLREPVKPCKTNRLFSKLRGSHRQRVKSSRSQVSEKWVTLINKALLRTSVSQTTKFHYTKVCHFSVQIIYIL